jgi:hypothetical protein
MHIYVEKIKKNFDSIKIEYFTNSRYLPKTYRNINTKKVSREDFRINLFMCLRRFSTIFQINVSLVLRKNCGLFILIIINENKLTSILIIYSIVHAYADEYPTYFRRILIPSEINE